MDAQKPKTMHERAIKKLLGREAENGVNDLQCTIKISNEKRQKKALRFGSEPATKKEKIQCKVAPVFAIYSAPKQTRPWSSFHYGKHWTFISRPYSCCFFFTAFLPFLSSKLLIWPAFFIPRTNFHIWNCCNHIRSRRNQLANIFNTLNSYWFLSS